MFIKEERREQNNFHSAFIHV